MFKNRAALLALAVLAIATAIMVFFVLPQINGGKDAGDMLTKAGDAAKNVAQSAADTAKEAGSAAQKVARSTVSSEVLRKMDRLKADASAASASLQALYADGKVPDDAQLAEAKAKLKAALESIAAFRAPKEGDAAVSSVATGLAASAQKALDTLKSMPADANQAAEAVSSIVKLFGDQSSSKNAVASSSGSAQSTAESDTAVDSPKLPSFDVLRVEKDGSTVIAGSAAPGSTVEVMDGDQAIASSKTGAEGDFAIVLDKPLSAGDHTLTLKAILDGGKPVISTEVATVSVPADKAGELLAMVSTPGKPSRILEKPEAEAKAVETAMDKQQPITPALPAASSTLSTSAPSFGNESSAQKAPAPKEQADQANVTAGKVPAGAAEIHIDAVEIEGDKIFVAGTSKPNTMVNVYADDQIVQATTSAKDGHFVAEGKMDLATGNHIIRADVMDSAGEKVVVRASVPFNRPAGDQVSVVADTAAPQQSGNQSAVIGGGQLEQMREEAAKALVLLKGLFADGKTPAKDQLAAAKSACEIAFKAIAGFKPAPDAGAEVIAKAEAAAKSASAALAVLDAAGDDPADVRAAVAKVEEAAKGAMPEVAKTITPAVASQPVKTEKAPAENTAPEPSTAPATQIATGPKDIEQAPLKKSENTVIIRKGDTLWQIARRVYGRGVRYTTIYLANQDQMKDPNLITPGQVFGVPDKVMQSDQDAEKINRKFQ